MDFPIRFLPTQTLAPETFLVRQIAGEGMGPEALALNTLVIRGAEPVIVDTGVGLTGPEWLDRTFELVEPEAVRWVYLSHDDTDHTGNLLAVLERCPQAKLVIDWFAVERLGGEGMEFPLDRLLILNPGESFVAGDRKLTAIIPPVFDSPTTRGLFDHVTGVYWAADAFAVMLPGGPVDSADEYDPAQFDSSFVDLQRLISPWHQWLDGDKYRAHVGALRAMEPETAVGCHGVALSGAHLEHAFDLIETLPDLPAVPRVGQCDLDTMLAALAA